MKQLQVTLLQITIDHEGGCSETECDCKEENLSMMFDIPIELQGFEEGTTFTRKKLIELVPKFVIELEKPVDISYLHSFFCMKRKIPKKYSHYEQHSKNNIVLLATIVEN